MRKQILVVDDNAIDRLILVGMLNKQYKVLEAENCSNVFMFLHDNAAVISAILLDLVMPEMDGFEMIKKLHANPEWAQIPIIVTTMLTDDESRIKAMKLGANNFISKPYNQELLLYTLANTIELREKSASVNSYRNDSLTGLPNRINFFEDVRRMLDEKEPGYYMITCFDIENFKYVNDQYGTEKGDEVLIYIAETVNQSISEIGGLCCRLMADKFGVIYPAEYKNSGKILSIHSTATKPDFIGRPLKARIGRYHACDLTLPVSTMFDRAALAGQTIKGRYDVSIAEYEDSMRANMLDEHEIISDMGRALAAGEFEPWFQPQYNHATGAMIGAEALVRWKKNGSYISPAQFIPIFERSGFIYEMDQYIWNEVCRLLRKWLDSGLSPLPVSVNISRRDLFHAHFINVFSDIVKKHNIPLDLIRLEVTESAFAEESGQIIGKVNQLIELGFTVEIDDFGSGYSSLNTLKDVPASILKLDMRFFENTGDSQRSGNILESVVRMAKWLGMAIIAEGVEEKSQADYLKSIGCYYIQGYYYARPMPLDEYEKLVRSSSVKESKLTHLETIENLNNNEFWNPKSMETLIFNSYVGGACIFEYHNGIVELLRVNDRYVDELGGLIPGGAHLNELDMVHYISKSSQKKMFDNIHHAIDTAKESTCELKLEDSSVNPPHIEYVRITVRVIAHAGERYLFYCVIVNITKQTIAEQKRQEAEKKRNESAAQLQMIMSNINGGVSAILIDDEGNSKFVFNNEKYYDLFGYTSEEAKGIKLDVISLILPEDKPGVLAKIRALKETGKPVIINYRCRKKDGRIIYIRTNSSLMSMEGYGDEVIASVVTDITEQKELEDQLTALVSNINGGVSAVVNKNGSTEFKIVNDNYFKILGYTREQYEKECKSRYDVIHPEDRERVISAISNSNGSKKRLSLEYRIICRDGSIRHIRNNISIINIFGVDEPIQLSVANDITELRTAQAKEIEAAAALMTVLNHAENGITATVYSDNGSEVLFINDKYYEILGYTRENYNAKRDKKLLSVIHKDDKELVAQKVKEAATTLKPTSVEFRAQRPDNNLVWVRVDITMTELPGYSSPIQLGVFSDITATKEYESQLMELNKKIESERKSIRSINQELLNNMPVGVAIFKYDSGKFSLINTNNHYSDLMGYDSQSKMDIDYIALLHPNDKEALDRKIEEAITTKGSVETVFRFLNAKKSYLSYKISAKAHPQDDGSYTFFVTYKPK